VAGAGTARRRRHRLGKIAPTGAARRAEKRHGIGLARDLLHSPAEVIMEATLTLPMWTIPPDAVATTLQPWQKRIVLAEDDDETRNLLAGTLRNHGYEVLEAVDGSDLIDWIQRLTNPQRFDGHPVAVIVSDNRMPLLEGLDVIATLGYLDWQMPFILMTAYGSVDTCGLARDLGVSDVLLKPFTVEQLEGAIERAVEIHRRAMEQW
jgi:CheY-like chemotaxis protein